MRGKSVRLVLALAALVGAAGCASSLTPTTSSSSVTITVGFDGTVGKNGASTHQFPVAGSGTVTVTLNTLTPADTTQMGMSLGTWNSTGVCQIILAKDTAAAGDTVTGTVTAAGTLCVRMYDAGTVSQDTAYTITVAHP
jgi:hypothetical protein